MTFTAFVGTTFGMIACVLAGLVLGYVVLFQIVPDIRRGLEARAREKRRAALATASAHTIRRNLRTFLKSYRFKFGVELEDGIKWIPCSRITLDVEMVQVWRAISLEDETMAELVARAPRGDVNALRFVIHVFSNDEGDIGFELRGTAQRTMNVVTGLDAAREDNWQEVLSLFGVALVTTGKAGGAVTMFRTVDAFTPSVENKPPTIRRNVSVS